MGIFPTARGFLRAPFLHGCHALAFLSRLSLIPCRTEEALRAATPWFPLAGLFLGLVWTAHTQLCSHPFPRFSPPGDGSALPYG